MRCCRFVRTKCDKSSPSVDFIRFAAHTQTTNIHVTDDDDDVCYYHRNVRYTRKNTHTRSRTHIKIIVERKVRIYIVARYFWCIFIHMKPKCHFVWHNNRTSDNIQKQQIHLIVLNSFSNGAYVCCCAALCISSAVLPHSIFWKVKTKVTTLCFVFVLFASEQSLFSICHIFQFKFTLICVIKWSKKKVSSIDSATQMIERWKKIGRWNNRQSLKW